MTLSSQYFKKLFFKDILRNSFSYLLQSILGFFIVLTIFFFKGEEYLGIFTQLYALMVIFGQLCTFGINDYVLKNIASSNNKYKKEIILSNSLHNLLIILVIFNLLFFMFSEYLDYYFKSRYISENLKFFSLLIIFFTINKIIFSYLNGSRMFKEFAFFNAFRPALILVNLIIFIKLNYSLNKIIFIFMLAELSLLILLFLKIKFNLFKIKKNKFFSPSIFGRKVFINSFLSETFIRIDILVLGYFLSDDKVGIYALAALFFEGIYQIPILLRNVLNPSINKYYNKEKINEFIKLIKYFTKISFLITFIFVTLTLVVLFFIRNLNVIEINDIFYDIVIILLLGNIIYSLVSPSENILFIVNKPSLQSLYMFSLTIINILLNYYFINKFGLIGAALGTLSTYFMALFIYNFFISKFTLLKKGLYFSIN